MDYYIDFKYKLLKFEDIIPMANVIAGMVRNQPRFLSVLFFCQRESLQFYNFSHGQFKCPLSQHKRKIILGVHIKIVKRETCKKLGLLFKLGEYFSTTKFSSIN